MKSADIREKFLGYFEKHGHKRVKSSSLIPAADPTLLFTNAGMVQFKDCFLGVSDPGYKRATTSQKCVRAGGKHNDLENVGFTARHHTFFEMLGNFSFGDYFKKEAIDFAWTFLTKELGIPKNRLRVTVFETDDEAAELWKAQGVDPKWIERLGEKDNFWAMGDTGPCGPCTEIHFDWYPERGADESPGNDPNARFVEIWNLVFMQFNRDSSGKMTPLPKPSVDTGAGLERLAAVMLALDGKHQAKGIITNYQTDLFTPITEAVRALHRASLSEGEIRSSSQVIADHLRSGSFLIADGVNPSNEGRGYVLRRILRRAIRHGKKLGQDKPFIHTLVPLLIQNVGHVYPELGQNQKLIEVMIREEEEKFHETLHRGMGILEDAIGKTKAAKQKVLPTDITFRLYDTFGFPLDLIEVIATEHDLKIDQAGFDQAMERQRSQSSWKGGAGAAHVENLAASLSKSPLETRFVGYDAVQGEGKLARLFDATGTEQKSLADGSPGFAVFEVTPFYAESGGQVGDQGTITSPSGAAKVHYTTKQGKAVVHQITVSRGRLDAGSSYHLQVDPKTRQATAINHTATHLLHAALRKILGDRVKQAGSLVDPTRLRFDFTFPRGLNEAELVEIEALVNAQVRERPEVDIKEMSYDEAMKTGALAFFDEKYGDRVRVIRVGGHDGGTPFSVELCGGTHLHNVADVGFFKILSESSVASGVRRIEAVTAEGALQYLAERSKILESLESKLGTRNELVVKKVETMIADLKTLQRDNERLQLKVAQSGASSGGGGGGALWDKAEAVGEFRVVAEQIPSTNPKVLRTLVDQIRDKLKDKTIIALACENEGKAAVCVGLTKDLIGRFHAGKLVQELAKTLGGSGGGREDFAQAGGPEPLRIPEALTGLKALIKG